MKHYLIAFVIVVLTSCQAQRPSGLALFVDEGFDSTAVEASIREQINIPNISPLAPKSTATTLEPREAKLFPVWPATELATDTKLDSTTIRREAQEKLENDSLLQIIQDLQASVEDLKNRQQQLERHSQVSDSTEKLAQSIIEAAPDTMNVVEERIIEPIVEGTDDETEKKAISEYEENRQAEQKQQQVNERSSEESYQPAQTPVRDDASYDELLIKIAALELLMRDRGGSDNYILEREVERTDTVFVDKMVSPEETSEKITALEDSIGRLNNQLRRANALASIKLDSVTTGGNDLTAGYLLEMRQQADSLEYLINELKAFRAAAPETKVVRDTVYITETKEVNAVKAVSDSAHFVGFYQRGSMAPSNQGILLNEIKKLKESRQIVTIKLSGYTDRSGSASVNMTISQRRVDLLKKDLVELGIPPQQIYTQAFGSTYASEEVVDSERRVEVTVILRGTD